MGFAYLRNFMKAVLRIDFPLFRLRLPRIAHVAAAHAQGAQKAGLRFALKGQKIQRIGMFQGKIRLGNPLNLRPDGRERGHQHAVGAVPLAGLGQRTVEAHHEAVGLGVLLLKAHGGALRPHRVRAGRAAADFVYFPDGLHIFDSSPALLSYHAREGISIRI